MSEFYGWLQGNRGETHRGGSKSSGIWAKVQSWSNQANISLNRNEKDEDDLTISFSQKDNGGRKLNIFINGVELTQQELEMIKENSELLKEQLEKLKVMQKLKE